VHVTTEENARALMEAEQAAALEEVARRQAVAQPGIDWMNEQLRNGLLKTGRYYGVVALP
jgi:hypothetical protein